MSDALTADTDATDAFDAAFAASAQQWGDEVDVDAALADVKNDVDGTAGDGLEEEFARDVTPDTGPANAASQHPIGIRGEKPGFDEVLKWMGDEWPEGAEVARSWQSDMSRKAGSDVELRTQMLDMVEEMKDLKASQGDVPVSPEFEAIPEQKIYTEEQGQLLEQWASDNGFVKQADLTAADEDRAARSAEHDVLAQGVEQYGGAFGELNDDGTVELSEDLKQQLQPIMQQIDEKGVTALDMVRMAGIFDPVETQGQPRAGTDQQPSAPRRSRETLLRANTSSRPVAVGAAGSTPQISFEGDGAEDVFDRAYALAKRAHSSR
tara:strand:- start:2393 stop:3358 length:966 start_codon:yes stop_codon:yes gene_type:complete